VLVDSGNRLLEPLPHKVEHLLLQEQHLHLLLQLVVGLVETWVALVGQAVEVERSQAMALVLEQLIKDLLVG
jgi:hypothetical protein